MLGRRCSAGRSHRSAKACRRDGAEADCHLTRLQRHGHVLTLPQQMRIYHDTYVARFPGARSPCYEHDFAVVAAKRRELESNGHDQR